MRDDRVARLDYNPFWIWFVQKPFTAMFYAVDKIMDGDLSLWIIDMEIRYMSRGRDRDHGADE